MTYQNDEDIGNAIQNLLNKRGPAGGRAGCPDENRLAAYLTGSISDQERDVIERHLAECRFCLSEVAAANQAGESSAIPTAPQRLTERAMALGSGLTQPKVFDLIVRWVKDSVEVVRQSGDWVTSMTEQPAALRGSRSPSANGLIHVERGFGEIKVAMEMERGESGPCQLSLSLFLADGTPAEGLRVSLLAGQREQASYLARQGKAVFDKVAKGNYSLIISRGRTSLGTITFAIEEG